MKRVIYTDSRGLNQVVEVPTDIIDETLYRHGIHLGPPELSALNLDEERRIALNNALCETGIIDYPSLSGHRHEVKQMMLGLGIPDQDARNLLTVLVALYQQDLLKNSQEQEL